MKVAYSFGIIDILHYGHIKTLIEAKENADLHVFGLVSDRAAISWLGTLVSDYNERYQVLQQVECIDIIMPQKSLDPVENLKKLHKEYMDAEIILYHGDDWKLMPASEYLKSIGGKVIFTEYYKKMTPENILRILNEQKEGRYPNSNLISTKANTLKSLQYKLNKSIIEEMMIISAGEFLEFPQQVFENIQKKYQGVNIIVRSSSSNEDCFESSNAGHYESVLNINSSNRESVINGIQTVVESYKKDLDDVSTEQILVQAQTERVRASGVLFTRDINANRPYYLINYDETGLTDTVTSGKCSKTIWIAKDMPLEQIEFGWRNLVEAVKEIELLLEGMILDIEFAINKKNQIIIFQVRPLAVNYRFNKKCNDLDFFELRNAVKRTYDTTINMITKRQMFLSDMAFWNPSEIIGDNPRNLDYSLYREIITKKAWNEGLVSMGYKDVPYELMYKVANKPYISLEYSFFSLIPADIGEELTNKLLVYYINKLKKDLTAHDKIEFEIVFSCFDFECKDKIKLLLEYDFTEQEVESITDSLFNLTKQALENYPYTLNEDLKALAILRNKRKRIEEKLSFESDTVKQLLSYIKSLLYDIQKYGTPQFSRQARYAFISKTLCATLISKGYFTQNEMDNFMSSIATVATEFEEDFSKYCSDEISRAEFNLKYGHLRSGTYDIRTMRYDKIDFDKIISISDKKIKVKPDNTILNPQIMKKALDDIGFNISEDMFGKFLKDSLAQREYFKFEFTKSLSLLLEILISVGEKLMIDRKLLSYLDVSDIFAAQYYDANPVLREFWLLLLKQKRKQYEEFSRLVLPAVIENSSNIDFVTFCESRPNFITNKIVEGDIFNLEANAITDIEGKIVVISNADPGYDWIFTKNIKGLVTQYGGVASHMAIRCAEFLVPAAIGCGKKIFEEVIQGKKLQLNCRDEKIIVRK